MRARDAPAIAAAACLVAGCATAEPIRDNLRFTLYHELGHAVIDQMRVPMTGPEEAAADGFALVLADRLHDEAEMAALIASVTALARAQAVAAIDPWSAYMPDGQRVAWTICVWYGLEPAARGALARALGMPRESAVGCAQDGRRIRAAWAPVLAAAQPGAGQGIAAEGRGKALAVLAPDIARLASAIALPRRVRVSQERCDEDNAFYYPGEARIVVCEEMVDALVAWARR